MKPLLVFLLSSAPLLALLADPIDVPSQISAVAVYADRARVTRTAELTIPAGENVLRFAGLPAGLDDSSVQAGGSGVGVKILGLEIRQQFSEQVVNDKVRDLEAQLQVLEDTQTELSSHKQDLLEQRSFLQKVRDGLALGSSDEGRTPPQGLDKVKPLYDFYRTELAAVTKGALDTTNALRELQPKKQIIQDELSRLRGNGAKAEKEVLVAVRAGGVGPAKVTLSYNMRGASWQPLYDARVNTKDGGIDLSYYGVVRQQTGEDWTNAKLSLSTARPSVGARMPDLTPWWIQLLQPMAVGYSGTMADGLKPQSKLALNQNSLVRDQKQGEEYASAPQAPAATDFEEETASIDTGGISAVFEIKIPATVPSDGEPHRVAISTQKFDGKLEYVTTPKLADLAYLKTRLTNASGAPIFGGEVNLFRDGDFVGQSRVNFIAPGAEFDFYLGVDDGVKVTRKTLVDKSAEGGLIQKRKSLTRKYEITVENFRSQPVKVEVLDQIPVSQDASIVISGVQFSQPPAKQDKDTGKLTWELTVDPQKKVVLTEDFTAEWPSDKAVQGL